MLQVCQIVASINREVGGPAITVPKLAESLAKQGAKCKLITLDYQHLGSQMPAPGVSIINLPAPVWTRAMRGWSSPLRSRLLEEARGMDVLHSHGVWMFPNLYARQAAIRLRIPLVLSPRGMLEEWSLGRSRIKKFIAWHLSERANLTAAALLHATSDAEASSLRKLGLRQPIAIIPNGVDLPADELPFDRKILESRHPELIDRRWLLFLSRIHPKKGVAELLTAWREVENRFPNWQLILAGPDLDGYAAAARARSRGIEGRVTFTGMLTGREKRSAFSNSDLFILPTHSENFGLAVAEALAAGLPVITTKGAPWRELETWRCGWWIDLNEAELVRSIGTAMGLSPGLLREMGRRGRELMARKYSWQGVGQQMFDAYKWLLKRGDKPVFVHSAT
jgi:glycosyltransferase involved in cell wall biosynthesis